MDYKKLSRVADSAKVQDSEGPKLTYTNLARVLNKKFPKFSWTPWYDDYYEEYSSVNAEVSEEEFNRIKSEILSFVKERYPDYRDALHIGYSDGEMYIECDVHLTKQYKR